MKSKKGKERKKKTVNEEGEEKKEEEEEKEEEKEEEEEKEGEKNDDVHVSKSAPGGESEISSSEEEDDSDTSTTDIEGEFLFNGNLSEQVRDYHKHGDKYVSVVITSLSLPSCVAESWGGTQRKRLVLCVFLHARL